MSTATIDTHVLNSLFDNQKRLDDVFNSVFDDDNYFISSVGSTESESHCLTYNKSRSFAPKPSRVNDSLQTIRKHYRHFYLLPVILEIAAIYWVVANFL